MRLTLRATTPFIWLILLAGVSAAEPTAPAGWTHWRGPSGQGYADDTRVPLTWGEKDNLLWKTPLPGKGNSTPIVWGDRIFLPSKPLLLAAVRKMRSPQ